MILQLNPPIWLSTPRGEGLAQLVIDYGLESDLLWVVALSESGQMWCFPNWDVRALKNESAGRINVEEMRKTNSKPHRKTKK